MSDTPIDNHPKCRHCIPLEHEPIWPVDDIEGLKMEMSYLEALEERNERDYQEHLKFKSQRELERVARKNEKQKGLGNQTVKPVSIITKSERSESLKQEVVEEHNMENGKKPSKTGTIDRLIKNDLGSKEQGTGSYAKGALTVIAQQVLDMSVNGQLDKSEVLTLKGLKGLAFSRRAVIAKAAREAAAEQVAA